MAPPQSRRNVAAAAAAVAREKVPSLHAAAALQSKATGALQSKATGAKPAKGAKLYHSTEAAAIADAKAAKAKKANANEVKRTNLPGAAGKDVPLNQLSRKELQAKALACGLKANAKSAELIKALEQMQAAATAGAMAGSEMLSNPMAAMFPKGSESAELADLDFLGIKGRTPGGTKWRSRAHTYNLRPRATGGGEAEAEVFTAEVRSTGLGL